MSANRITESEQNDITRGFDPKFAQSPPARVLSQRARLVYPFQISQPAMLNACAEKLASSSNWKREERINEEFRKEMLEEASNFVFGVCREDRAAYYFRSAGGIFDIHPNTRNAGGLAGPLFGCFLNGGKGAKWYFNGLAHAGGKTAATQDRPAEELRFRVDRKHDAELFLNPFGGGVLSITILIEDLNADAPWGHLLDSVYHLSHLKYRAPMIWRCASDEAGPRDTALPRQLEGPPSKEGADTGGVSAFKQAVEGFEERGLADGGGSGSTGAIEAARTPGQPFTWRAWIEDMLAPIHDLIGGTQGQLTMYSVVEFAGEGADFGQDLKDYAAAICSMAELEEGSHAPRAEADALGEVLRLTERHIVAASSMGIAHFVSRQPQGLRFEDDRAQRILVKYFASALAAYFQSIGLNHYERETVRGLGKPGGLENIGKLANEIASFVASANLGRINRRDSHNRYYDHLRTAMRTGFGMVSLQRTLRDLGQSLELQEQTGTLGKIEALHDQVLQAQKLLQETQAELGHDHKRLANLELFIVMVYVLEMAHVFGTLTGAKHGYSLIAAVTGMFVGLILVILMVKRPAWVPKKIENSLISVSLVFMVLYCAALVTPVWVENLREPVKESQAAPAPPPASVPSVPSVVKPSAVHGK